MKKNQTKIELSENEKKIFMEALDQISKLSIFSDIKSFDIKTNDGEYQIDINNNNKLCNEKIDNINKLYLSNVYSIYKKTNDEQNQSITEESTDNTTSVKSETSENTDPINGQFSSTSEMSDMKNMNGKNKIFKSSISNLEKYNFKNDNHSSTSNLVLTGGNSNDYEYSATSEIPIMNIENKIFKSSNNTKKYNLNSDNYSSTSNLNMKGGKVEDSDTLMSITELAYIKNNSSNKSKNNLDLNIFKKKFQNGGKSNSQILDIGINSSSTSSICE